MGGYIGIVSCCRSVRVDRPDELERQVFKFVHAVAARLRQPAGCIKAKGGRRKYVAMPTRMSSWRQSSRSARQVHARASLMRGATIQLTTMDCRPVRRLQASAPGKHAKIRWDQMRRSERMSFAKEADAAQYRPHHDERDDRCTPLQFLQMATGRERRTDGQRYFRKFARSNG